MIAPGDEWRHNVIDDASSGIPCLSISILGTNTTGLFERDPAYINDTTILIYSPLRGPRVRKEWSKHVTDTSSFISLV